MHSELSDEGSQSVALLVREELARRRLSVQWLEGTYLTLRPAFSEPGAVFAYLTSIAWDDARAHLTFSEAARTDCEYEQKGFVSFPVLSGAIYLVTISDGQY